MKLSISNKQFDHKPIGKEYEGLTFRTIEIENDYNTLMDIFTSGNALAFIYRDTEFPHEGHYKSLNYVGTDFLIIDADHCGDYDWIETLVPKPTLWTTTFSASENDCRCHIIYALNETLYGTAAYNALWHNITSKYPREADKNARSPKRLFHTTNKNLPNFISGWLGGQLDVSQYKGFITNVQTHTPREYSKKDNSEVEIDKRFLEDYNTMSREEFLVIYNLMFNIKRETAVDFENKLFVNWEGKDYYKVKDKVEWRDGKAKKRIVQKGERNTSLFNDARQFLSANEDMSIEELIYAMTLEIEQYYDNSDGELDNQYIVSKLKRIYKDFQVKRVWGTKTKRKAVINNGLYKWLYPNVKPIERVHQAMRAIKDEKIAESVNTSQTIEENLKLLKEKGVLTSKKRLKDYLKRNNVYLDTKKDRIIRLLREEGEGLSLRKKVNLCQEHGIKVSINTIRQIESESVSEMNNCTDNIKVENTQQCVQIVNRDTPIDSFDVMVSDVFTYKDTDSSF